MKNRNKSSVIHTRLVGKKYGISKSKFEWAVLVVLILLVPISIWANLFNYEYYYFKCEGQPIEIEGSYYRAPDDEGYGIHPGSSYGSCQSVPLGVRRDPSTKAGAAIIKRQTTEADRLKRLAAEYKVYVPNGYKVTNMLTLDEVNSLQTTFDITTSAGDRFSVSEMKKGAMYDYAALCYKPPEENWSGTIIGEDGKGRSICRTNPSKYVTSYTASIYIGNTAIMLRAITDKPVASLDTDVTVIFSAL